MIERFKEEKKYQEQEAEPGPIITISRETGCSAKEIAQLLNEEIAEIIKGKGRQSKWKWISKEILDKSAKELELEPSKLDYIFDAEVKSTMDEVISALSSRYYKSDRKIRKTVKEVIGALADKGHIIIVGRAGVSITSNIDRALHIKLQAPLEWRSNALAEKQGITLEEAKKFAIETDKKRKKVLDHFSPCKTDSTIFDVIYNCKSLSQAEIVKSILQLMEEKKLI